MLKGILRAASVVACTAFVSSAANANDWVQMPLDNTQSWSMRMIESEMVRFPEAWDFFPWRSVKLRFL